MWEKKTKEKKIYLTFDDGPTPEVTPWVLETLAGYGAKATFFCLGRNVERNPELYQQIIDQGHRVGNHTYSHLKGWKVPLDQYLQDIDLCAQFIDSDLFRPPYGKITISQIKALRDKYTIVMWSLMSMDYSRRISPRKCYRIMVNHAKNGGIIVLHDSEKTYRKLKYALPRFIEKYKQAGYTFETV